MKSSGTLACVSAERLCDAAPQRVGVDVVNALCARYQRVVDGEESEAPNPAMHEDARARAFEQAIAHGDVGVGEVVARARRGDRIDSLGHAHEHGIREWHAHAIREQSPPMTANRHAETRVPAYRDTLCSETTSAAIAVTAANVPRHDNDISRRNRSNAVADIHHFRDAFMADRKRRIERRKAANDALVQIAGRRSNRPHDGLVISCDYRGRLFAPLELPFAYEC